MSQIVTFYSYKGGVGRSMALANVAVLLSSWGYKTLIIDWDLEAPGIENYFREFISIKEVYKKEGVIDLLLNLNNDPNRWTEMVTPIFLDSQSNPLHLISSGKQDENYFDKIRKFDIDTFYDELDGGYHLENLRKELKENYDFVLIDSRTGITDNGGICTIQLPDINVLLFTATDQGFNGILDVSLKAQKAHQNLPFERQKLISIPIPSRFDNQTEFKISQEWLDKFAKELKPIYNDWLPTFIKQRQIVEITKIPYVPYFSFGEKLPVLEQGVDDPSGLGYAFETLGGILANNVQDIKSLLFNRENYIKNAHKNSAQKKNILIKEEKENKLDEVNIFISYAHTDRKYKDQLKSHLSTLSNKYEIVIWDDDLILPGMKRGQEIIKNIEKAEIALVLISPNYISSKWITDNEFPELLKKKIVIPIMIRETKLYDTELSSITSFQPLPNDFRPISDSVDIGKEFNEIVVGVEKSIGHFLKVKQKL